MGQLSNQETGSRIHQLYESIICHDQEKRPARNMANPDTLVARRVLRRLSQTQEERADRFVLRRGSGHRVGCAFRDPPFDRFETSQAARNCRATKALADEPAGATGDQVLQRGALIGPDRREAPLQSRHGQKHVGAGGNPAERQSRAGASVSYSPSHSNTCSLQVYN
jgi:hypothetical protein